MASLLLSLSVAMYRMLSFTQIVAKSIEGLSTEQAAEFQQDWLIAQDLVWSDPTDNVLAEPKQHGHKRHDWIDKLGAVVYAATDSTIYFCR